LPKSYIWAASHKAKRICTKKKSLRKPKHGDKKPKKKGEKRKNASHKAEIKLQTKTKA
jgi:hypothetical protein